MEWHKYWLRNRKAKTTEQELGFKFIRTDSDKEEFDTFRAINEIFKHIKQSTKITLIYKISPRLLRLEFKSDNVIKSKAIRFIAKKYILIMSNNGNLLRQI